MTQPGESPQRPEPIWERLPTRCGFDYEEYPYRVRAALVKHLCALLASQTYSVDAAVG